MIERTVDAVVLVVALLSSVLMDLPLIVLLLLLRMSNGSSQKIVASILFRPRICVVWCASLMRARKWLRDVRVTWPEMLVALLGVIVRRLCSFEVPPYPGVSFAGIPVFDLYHSS